MLHILEKLKPEKTVGVDNIHPKYLRKVRPAMPDPLLRIWEPFVDEKNAKGTSIFKKRLISACSNYRPLDLTSQICKVFELIIRSVLINYLQNLNLIKDSQHGFLSGRS